MNKYKVTMEWNHGFKSQHYVIGGKKAVDREIKRLNNFSQLKEYNIEEVSFNGF